jgi:predicted RNA methylase
MLTLADCDIYEYDFLDFGAGSGGSIELCEKLFGGRGLGIDIDPKKIKAAQRAGRQVVYIYLN